MPDLVRAVVVAVGWLGSGAGMKAYARFLRLLPEMLLEERDFSAVGDDSQSCREQYQDQFNEVVKELRVWFSGGCRLSEFRDVDVEGWNLRRINCYCVLRQMREMKKGERGEKNVIVFDWDDTVLATSFLLANSSQGLESVNGSNALLKRLEILDRVALQLFKLAGQLARVIVITNSGCGWVEESAARFLPQVHDFLRQNRVNVISARDKFSNLSPDSPSEWKMEAMKEQLQEEHSHRLNVMVLGDCYSDQYAAHAVHRNLAQSIEMTMKFVKLATRPSIEKLVEELTLLQLSLERMMESKSSFDISISRSCT